MNLPIGDILLNMLEGTVVSLKIFFLTVAFSVPLGVLVALGRMSKFKWISQIVRFYQLVMRGTPLILQLLFFAFAPYYIFGYNLERFLACMLAFVINYAAYFGEIFRSGISSIPEGQYEAAKVLGYSKFQTFIKIILPQVIKIIMPTMGSEFMTLIKDTALAYTVGITELYRVASTAQSKYFDITPLVFAGIFYLVMNTVVEYLFKKIENKLDYYKM